MADRGVLVITGAGRGIGAATARLAAQAGYAVVVNYLSRPDAAASVVTAIQDAGGTAIAVRGDIADPGDVEHVFAAADRLGALTGLVNNAAVVLREQRVEAVDAGQLNRMLAVNVTGAMLCSAAAIRRMSTARGGHGGGIVNLTSGAAKIGAPGQYVGYAASKGALDTFTVGLAQEVAGEGIRVNAVRAGIVDTEIHAESGNPQRAMEVGRNAPLGRAAQPEEIARAVLWLLSDEASYCCGTILSVTGGRALFP